MKEHCCQIDCKKDAEWEIYADGVPDTAACTEHVGELLTDANEHRIFRLNKRKCKSCGTEEGEFSEDNLCIACYEASKDAYESQHQEG